MFHEQKNELFAVDEGNGRLVRLHGFSSCSGTEVAGRDDESLFMRAETSSYLLNGRRLNVVLKLPFFACTAILI